MNRKDREALVLSILTLPTIAYALWMFWLLYEAFNNRGDAALILILSMVFGGPIIMIIRYWSIYFINKAEK